MINEDVWNKRCEWDLVIPKKKRNTDRPKIWNKNKFCIHPHHGFPMHLYIRPGESYTHKCPGCGVEQTVIGTEIIF